MKEKQGRVITGTDEEHIEKTAYSVAMEKLWQLQQEASKEYTEKIDQAYKEAHTVYVRELSKLRNRGKKQEVNSNG